MDKKNGGGWVWIILIIVAILWWSSTKGRDTEADRHVVEGSTTLFNPKGNFDEDSARDDAKDDVAASSFSDVGDPSTCTDDCGGHDAGFEWAKENGVTDASECSGSSTSFVEGCEAFAQAIEHRVEQERSEHDESEDTES